MIGELLACKFEIERRPIFTNQNASAVMICLKYKLIGKLGYIDIMHVIPTGIGPCNVLRTNPFCNPLLHRVFVDKCRIKRVTIV